MQESSQLFSSWFPGFLIKNLKMFQRLLKHYNYLALLCCLLLLSTACGKKAPPTPLSEVRELEQKKQENTKPDEQVIPKTVP